MHINDKYLHTYVEHNGARVHQNHSLTGNGRLINSINCEWLDVEYIICADDQINPNYVERLVAHALVPCFSSVAPCIPGSDVPRIQGQRHCDWPSGRAATFGSDHQDASFYASFHLNHSLTHVRLRPCMFTSVSSRHTLRIQKVVLG